MSEAQEFFGKKSRSPGGLSDAELRTSYSQYQFNVRSAVSWSLIMSTLLRLLDFISILLIGYLIFVFYVEEYTAAEEVMFRNTILMTAVVAAILFEFVSLYPSNEPAVGIQDIRRLLIAWTISIAFLLFVVFFSKAGAQYSRVWLLSWYLTSAATMVGARMFFAYGVGRWIKVEQIVHNAILVGSLTEIKHLIEQLENDPSSGVRIRGVFSYQKISSEDRAEIGGHIAVGSLSEILAFQRHTPIDMAVLAFPPTAKRSLNDVMEQLQVLPIDIRLAANIATLPFKVKASSLVGQIPVFNIVDKPIEGWNFVIKWLFDKVVAVCLLVLLSPIMLLIALLIKLEDGGAIFFKQKRVGFRNELINIYKFRSMYEKDSDRNASRLVTKDDPRVTRIGRFLRKTSLDELPQLLNVLMGDLSLVGPRPHALNAKADDKTYDKIVDEYFARHKVKPGMTGWAQINGWRGETDTYEKIRKRVEFDLYYIDNWSILFDLIILLRTPLALLSDEQAY